MPAVKCITLAFISLHGAIDGVARRKEEALLRRALAESRLFCRADQAMSRHKTLRTRAVGAKPVCQLALTSVCRLLVCVKIKLLEGGVILGKVTCLKSQWSQEYITI